ncbi:MAG: hypothetical protein KC643_31240, partial [Nitrospira sp.]|nr:hypothetical protein [Nitrospira sp.]
MHAGLVPIISYESGIDVFDYGYSLRECSVENIRRVIKEVAELSPSRVEEMARGAWEYARCHYTRENFSRQYTQAILEILSDAR